MFRLEVSILVILSFFAVLATLIFVKNEVVTLSSAEETPLSGFHQSDHLVGNSGSHGKLGMKN